MDSAKSPLRTEKSNQNLENLLSDPNSPATVPVSAANNSVRVAFSSAKNHFIT